MQDRYTDLLKRITKWLTANWK